MDTKVTTYKRLVRDLAIEVANMGDLTNRNIETQTITDDEHGHYLLYFSGWEGRRRTYGCFFHVDVSPDGKVWLQYDGTDLKIAEMLAEKGIPKNDIVLGFHAPESRQYLPEYALA